MQLGTYLDRVRQNVPLVHNITNYVTVNDVANALLAIGASPIMADEVADAVEITRICNALNINIGTLNTRTIAAMQAAGEQAAQLGHVLVLDPVGAGASALRTDTATALLTQLPLTCVRGNISEVKALAIGSGTTRGVDAAAGDAVTEATLAGAVEFVKHFAAAHRTVAAVTGAIDIVTDGERTITIHNGRPEMSKITGTGCQLSGITAAFLAANPDDPLDAAAAAVAAMGVAGEIGWAAMLPGDGNSTYRNRIIDALYNLTGSQLEEMAHYEEH